MLFSTKPLFYTSRHVTARLQCTSRRMSDCNGRTQYCTSQLAVTVTLTGCLKGQISESFRRESKTRVYIDNLLSLDIVLNGFYLIRLKMNRPPSIVPCIAWVKRGIAKKNPDKVRVTFSHSVFAQLFCSDLCFTF